MARLIVLVGIIILLLLSLSWLRRTPRHQVRKVLGKALLWGAVGLLLLAVLTGRLNPVFAALAALVPVLARLLQLVRLAPVLQQLLQQLGLVGPPGTGPTASGGRAGGVSAIRTRYLYVRLEHASGRMDGTVIEGPFHGRELSDLGLDELVRMLELYRDTDPQSAAVLEAYLDRQRGEDWRDTAGPGSTTGATRAGPLSREDAYAILGLEPDADADAIRDAHRRLIARLHPDRGGSDYLAAQINAAKALLLGE